MTWLDTFREVDREQVTLASVLLKDRIPLSRKGSRLASSLVERASGVLASRLPVRLKPGEKRRLIFLLPNATQSLGRHLAVSLLLADFVHRQGCGIPPEEKGRLIPGDLLLVTQHIRECVGLLREVAIRYGTESLPLTKFWPIEVLSQYSPPVDDKPRVFVANPGWAAAMEVRRRFGTVVIDVSHPRTGGHIDTLLKHPSIKSSPAQIFIFPPCEQARLNRLNERGRESYLAWAWDPAAVDALEQIVEPARSKPIESPSERLLWLTDDDETDEILAGLHELLVGAMRAGGGRLPAPLLEAWSVYHRFRQLAVPLLHLEEARRKAYRTVTLKERIAGLEESSPSANGPLGSYLDARWPQIIRTLGKLYDLFIEQKEPAKFYTLACVLQEELERERSSGEDQPIRIVAPTAHEGSMLAALLGDLVDGWADALQAGRAVISTVREEPRLVAEGNCCPSILLGFRTSDTRYLDVYPRIPIHVVAYPFEAEVDEAIQARVHTTIERLQENGPRTTVLRSLRLPVTDGKHTGHAGVKGADGTSPRSERPLVSRRVETRTVKTLKRRFQADDAVEPLDIEKLAGMTWSDEIVLGSAGDDEAGDGSGPRGPIEFVEILDASGERFRYPAARLVDVYHPATEIKERIPAAHLKPGMLMVALVDDYYDNVFERLLDAIREDRDIRASMALDLWQCAKQAALSKYRGNRRRLFEALASAGLGVKYEAVVGWFNGGEDEIIAPLDESDFHLLAKASGLYSDPDLMRATFACIRSERVLRRRCGRLLGRLLSQIAAGQHYEAAIRSAKAIGTPLEQLAAAVSVREVISVQRIGTLLSMH
ncbi:hypothetical protein [Tautonia sociabilis]|uniref:Uncharacterized protein n=1 Tax=Tautonia sociabilis TaxID=2080755 RepID=A0A432MF40_9BACT|nr:hypothetical protein [Tautonia sociabilis]RUL84578.1 hypothetical protein TsocGM_20090 [Tautonia sociabilis]